MRNYFSDYDSYSSILIRYLRCLRRPRAQQAANIVATNTVIATNTGYFAIFFGKCFS